MKFINRNKKPYKLKIQINSFYTNPRLNYCITRNCIHHECNSDHFTHFNCTLLNVYIGETGKCEQFKEIKK